MDDSGRARLKEKQAARAFDKLTELFTQTLK